jgi:hypothetical protein
LRRADLGISYTFVMSHGRSPTTDLESLINVMASRFEYDTLERIVASRTDGVAPRFVFARASEGCACFGCGVEEEVVIAVARLAAREPGLGTASPGAGPPPERLEMMRRRLEEAGGSPEVVFELLEHEGRLLGEIWSLR